jgi:hypothetical protein
MLKSLAFGHDIYWCRTAGVRDKQGDKGTLTGAYAMQQRDLVCGQHGNLRVQKWRVYLDTVSSRNK